MNNTTAGAIYWIRLSDCTNTPPVTGYGYLEHYGGLQRFTQRGSATAYIRSYVNNAWEAWLPINGVQIFSIPAGKTYSVKFSGGSSAFIMCTGSQGNLRGAYVYSGYAHGGTNVRCAITELMNFGAFTCQSSPESSDSTNGFLIKNGSGNTAQVSVIVMYGALVSATETSTSITTPVYKFSLMSDREYGTSLPAAGSAGRLFFKKA